MLTNGIKLLTETRGQGAPAVKGDRVTYNARLFLRRGDEVTPDTEIIARARSQLAIRMVDGIELIDHQAVLGRREPIAGVERALYGMRCGGYRELEVSPHLAYGEAGVTGRIPPAAMLRVRLWLQQIEPAPKP